MQKITLEEIKKIPGPYLMPHQIARYVRMSEQVIRVRAHKRIPEPLPYEVDVSNSWTRILKGSFIKWAEDQEGFTREETT